MKYFRMIVILWIIISIGTFAKVKLLLSPTVSTSIKYHNPIETIFQPIIEKNEWNVYTKFIHKKANFAIIRKDLLANFLAKKRERDYHIIGKISTKTIIYFFSIDNKIQTVKDLVHKRISIGNLGDKANLYLKHILHKNHMKTYLMHMLSYDFYHSLDGLKRGSIDAIFLFGPEVFSKQFKTYIKPYPKGFMETLYKEIGLSCEKNNCHSTYYLIAADNVGQEVMHNIYQQVAPILVSQKELNTNFGIYYIDFKKYASHHTLAKRTINQTNKNLHFGRAPWMDIAINEAIKGKGSAENILPMLDLSYKYIRFAKGEQGITTAPNDNKEGSWCAAYICWTLNKSGYPIHKKGRMASQSFRYFNHKIYKKIKTPIFGAITLYTNKRNIQHGHVGYLFGRTKRGDNILLGGNQNNRLKFSSYPVNGFGSNRFDGFYVPVHYDIKQKDTLSKKDVYTSAKVLNRRFGIKKSQQTRETK